MTRTKLRSALQHVTKVWQQHAAAGTMSLETVDLYIQTAERLLRFADAQDATRLDDITSHLVLAFIEAPGHDRHQGIVLNPAAGTRRQRRSAIEALFTEARALGLTKTAPLVDLPPIPRSPRKPGTWLGDNEIRQLRFQAERGMPATRNAPVLALLLAGMHSAEIAAATTDDLDLDGASIWTGGATRTYSRHCHLDDWAVHVLRLRSAHLLRTAEPSLPQRLATGASSAYRAQASVCTAFGDVARRSGLASAHHRVEPRDITRFTARAILAETGQLSEVARRLGYSSLDSAAALASLQWLPEDGETA